MSAKRVTVGGVTFDALTEDLVVDHVLAALERGQGGRILTPNVDVLRQITRNGDARDALKDSTLVVADGMPVIWASRLAGTPLPQRVSGADLIWSLSRGLCRDGRSLFVLGGEPLGIQSEDLPPNMGTTSRRRDLRRADSDVPTWTNELRPPVGVEENLDGRHSTNAYKEGVGRNVGPAHRAAPAGTPRNRAAPFARVSQDGAGRAAAALQDECPGLNVVGAISPPYGFEADPESYALLCKEVIEAQPDLVLVGVGFPRQERVIASLRADLPNTWFLGCGQAINFAAGEQRRAPEWMQRAGVEWLHRMAAEPRRLAERYLRHDLPFVARLMARTVVARYRKSTPGRHSR